MVFLISVFSLAPLIKLAPLALIATAPDSHLKALVPSSAIHYAGDWINVIPSRALRAAS